MKRRDVSDSFVALGATLDALGLMPRRRGRAVGPMWIPRPVQSMLLAFDALMRLAGKR